MNKWAAILSFLVFPANVYAVECNGSELVCLDLTSQNGIQAAGGTVVGGDFNGDGFSPTPGGGIDFDWGPNVDLSSGTIEFEIQGLLPIPGGELEGGKVSLFSFCGKGAQDNKYIGMQKMDESYREGHVFRYGMDDDGLADNWDAVIITSQDFGCQYTIANPPWQPGDTHHIYATWGPEGLYLLIDGVYPCSNPNFGGGNGDTFDPAQKFLALANRCQHYDTQTALARYRNLKVWATGGGGGIPEPEEEKPAPPPADPAQPSDLVIEASWIDVEPDGYLTEWVDNPSALMGNESYVQANGGAPNQGDTDLSADMWVGWEGDSLKVAIEVTDDIHEAYPVSGKLWKGDSIQVAVDVEYDQHVDGYLGDDWEMGLAWVNGQLMVDCYHVPSGVGGDCPIEVGATRQGNITSYEVSIPNALGAGTIGLSVLVNERDAGYRKGWLELSEGVGHIKSPALFATAVMVGEAAENPIVPDGEEGEDDPNGSGSEEVDEGVEVEVEEDPTDEEVVAPGDEDDTRLEDSPSDDSNDATKVVRGGDEGNPFVGNNNTGGDGNFEYDAAGSEEESGGCDHDPVAGGKTLALGFLLVGCLLLWRRRRGSIEP